MSGIDAPAGLAFDFAGNLWVAANGRPRSCASTRATTDSSARRRFEHHRDDTVARHRPLSYPLGIPFDGNGNLWVNYDDILARLTPANSTAPG